MKPVDIPCPYCGVTIQVTLFQFIPGTGSPGINHWHGHEVLCPSCGHYATFPKRARIPAVILGFAVAGAELFASAHFFPAERDDPAIYLATILIGSVSFAVVSSLVIRAYGVLIAVDNPT